VTLLPAPPVLMPTQPPVAIPVSLMVTSIATPVPDNLAILTGPAGGR
jgi:hypothetical protein